MHYFLFEASPKPDSEHYGSSDGAYINCWVNDPVLSSAELTARQFLAEAGWDLDVCEEAHPVSRADYAADPTGQAYFDQALTDEVVAVVNRWPIGAPDED